MHSIAKTHLKHCTARRHYRTPAQRQAATNHRLFRKMAALRHKLATAA